MSVELLSSVLVDAARVAILLAASAPIAWLLARGPARARSSLWLAVLAGALLTPLLTRVLDPVEVVIPGWVVERSNVPILEPATQPSAVSLAEARGNASADRPARGDVTTVVAPVPAEGGTWWNGVPVAAALWVWGTGAIVLMFRTAFGYWRIARIVGRGRPVVDPEWAAVVRRATRRVGCRRTVRLLWTDELDVPATTGLIRPTVLLPAVADRWLIERREVVLMHEIVHVRRMDWAARIVARLVTALHWFDPLAWWASSRLDREQERACDEAVLGAGVRASTYAAHLLEIARTARPRPALSVPALELTRRTEVEERIMHVLDTKSWRHSAALFGLPVIVIIGSLVPAIAAIRPAPEAPPAATAPLAVVASPLPAPVAPGDEPRPAIAPQPAPDRAPSPPPAPEQAADPELSQLIRDVERLEAQIEQSVGEIDDTVRRRIEEKVREMESVRLEVDERRLEEVEARIEAELAGIENIEVDLEPVRLEMEEVAHAIEAIELESEMDAEEMRQAIEPHLERLQELRLQIEPVHVRMERLQEVLEPLQVEMQSAQQAVQERHLEMERLHAELEPLTQEIERLHETIEPIRGELERTAEQIDRAVAREVESAIRAGMASVVAADAPFDEAARRVVAASEVRIEHGALIVYGPAGETRMILSDLMRVHRRSDDDAFESALESTVRELTPLRRSVELE